MDKKFLGVLIAFVVVVLIIACIGLTSDDAPPVTTTVITTEPTTLAPIENAVTTEVTTEPAKKEFTTAKIDYLDDALFIGDSRTVGLEMYSDAKNADYFCTVGMSSFKVFSESAKVDGVMTSLKSLLSTKKYGKIYIMLGINELGYNRTTSFNKYKELVDTVRELQSDAIIFIQGNIHVGASRSASDTVINNKAINEFNSMIAELQNEEDIFYINVSECFDDSNGNLDVEYSNDGIHLHVSDYNRWIDYVLTKAIV